MKKLLAFFFILIPFVALAQEGMITYDRAIKTNFQVPERMRDRVPAHLTQQMLLLFRENESVMALAPTKKDDVQTDAASARMRGMATRLRMGSSSRTDQEMFLETYCNLESGMYVETREFMTRTFLLEGEQPAYAWKLSGEQSEFLGFPVQKATAVQDSISIEVWFTPEIPISGGPGLYGGLPGMILVASIDEGNVVYSATEVSLDGLAGREIIPPKKGQKVTETEYEAIVEEKLEEIRTTRSRRGRDRR